MSPPLTGEDAEREQRLAKIDEWLAPLAALSDEKIERMPWDVAVAKLGQAVEAHVPYLLAEVRRLRNAEHRAKGLETQVRELHRGFAKLKAKYKRLLTGTVPDDSVVLPRLFTCAECGGDVVNVRSDMRVLKDPHTGESHDVPADLDTPTCTDCGEPFFSTDWFAKILPRTLHWLRIAECNGLVRPREKSEWGTERIAWNRYVDATRDYERACRAVADHDDPAVDDGCKEWLAKATEEQRAAKDALCGMGIVFEGE